jgi:hypothetical protein
MNLPCFWARGFGSCHSFGVAVGLRGYGMCQKRGENFSTVAVRWADMVRIFIRSRVPCFIFCFSVPR